ncbi:MAG: MauE/DoxX family redox-associated membrane protein, partial [Bryobacteraceae bacterium]
AGTAKALNISCFRLSLATYEFVKRKQLIDVIAFLLIPIEICTGFSLLISRFLPWSIWSAVVLLLAFTIWVTVAVIAGRRNINCGCLTVGRNKSVGWHVCVRNLGMICLVLPSNMNGFIGVLCSLFGCAAFGISIALASPSHQSDGSAGAYAAGGH